MWKENPWQISEFMPPDVRGILWGDQIIEVDPAYL